jgi:uncharacterized protein
MEYRKLIISLLLLPALVLGADEPSQEFLDNLALAEQGDAQAQFNLAEMSWNAYFENRLPQDLEDYTRWASLAAEQGHPDALYGLGVRYINSTADHPVDLTEGLRLLHLAGELESWEAQRYLAELYFRGPFFQKDYNQGIRWLRMGASQGTTAAQSALAREYRTGNRVLQDKIQAYVWFSMAVMQGDFESVSARDEIEAELSIGQLSIARELSTRCFDSGFQDCE